MSRRVLFLSGFSLAAAAWTTGGLMAALPVPVSREWLLFVLAVGITSALMGLVIYCQRTVDEVAAVFYAAGRRDAIREMNSTRSRVVKLPSQRMDA